MDAILPAAGLATRMRGLPKFLLPCSETYETLIERHISHLLERVDRIWIPTRPQNAALLELLEVPGEKVVLLSVNSKTMSETVMRVLDVSSASHFSMFMPDTYFLGEQPYEFMSESSDLSLALWRIRHEQMGKLGQVNLDDATGNVIGSRDKDPKCTFPFSWGAMSFSRQTAEFIDPKTPHIGYMIEPALAADIPVRGQVMNGAYFDCGTPREYFSLTQSLGALEDRIF